MSIPNKLPPSANCDLRPSTVMSIQGCGEKILLITHPGGALYVTKHRRDALAALRFCNQWDESPIWCDQCTIRLRAM